MTRSILTHAMACLLLIAALLGGSALAQDRLNFLAINGEMSEAGPYYFVAFGDSGNAFMRASAFARAVDLTLVFDDGAKQLRIGDGERRIVIDATADVRHGLVKRPGALRAGDRHFESPMAILVDGVSYVPITPIVAALGGASDWHPAARVVTIEMPDPDAVAELAPPRIGSPTPGITRVALDLPRGHDYAVTVWGSSLAVMLEGTRAPDFSHAPDDPNIVSVAYELIDGVVALVVHTRFPIAANGVGFRVGQLHRDAHDVLYVDFSPDVRGEAVVPVPEGAVTPPPPPAVTAVMEAQPRRYTVVIDAGHGGRDPGAVAPWGREKEIALDVSLRLKQLLEAQGVQVIMTRTSDVYVEFPDRSAQATNDRNIFVSIHANAADNRAATGIETWVFGQPLDPSLIARAIRENGGGDIGEARTAEAQAIASDIAGEIWGESRLNLSMGLASTVQDRLVRATGARDRGVRQNLFYVIRNSRIPAVLVELGFVSNPDEGARLVDATYQDSLARALAEAIMEFLTKGGSLASL
ncbi:MAG: N-acetylmuramoyl-L-alanine amidase [Trueperaceae bacterium]|nr:N-acetylmuramoyl-L-alanine amidase [Trueperaceae bacterium]